MRAGRGGEGAMADKARAASAYRTAHARGAVGRVGVALVRTAALARAGVSIQYPVVELHSGQWRAGDVGVAEQAEGYERHAGEEVCGEPLQLVVVQRKVLERCQAVEDARRQRRQLIVGQVEVLDTAHVVKHAWRQRRDAFVVEIQPARLVGALARALQRAVARLAKGAPAERARQPALISRISTHCRRRTRRRPNIKVGVLSARARRA